MSTIFFAKYQGAGNDFVLIDDRALQFNLSLIPKLTNRKFGIGADGVILLQNSRQADFRMRIFNSDGTEAESCGNGLCCLTQFLLSLGFEKKTVRVETGKRIVTTYYSGDKIGVEMGSAVDVKQLYIDGMDVHFLDTGVPHAVVFSAVDLAVVGPFLRNHPLFHPRGVNVSVAQPKGDGSISVRTFERGVEAETLACGTGAAAVGFIASKIYKIPNPVQIYFPGGQIEIAINGEKITLLGEGKRVFSGEWILN